MSFNYRKTAIEPSMCVQEGIETASGVDQKTSTAGVLKCAECEFKTVSRAQLKMHSMKHRPHKWQCGHCSLTFTLLYVTPSCLVFSSDYVDG